MFSVTNHSYVCFLFIFAVNRMKIMSIELGKFNQLEVVKQVDFGMYLDGEKREKSCCPPAMYPKIVSWETG